jgi:hypothetical protein
LQRREEEMKKQNKKTRGRCCQRPRKESLNFIFLTSFCSSSDARGRTHLRLFLSERAGIQKKSVSAKRHVLREEQENEKRELSFYFFCSPAVGNIFLFCLHVKKI